MQEKVARRSRKARPGQFPQASVGMPYEIASRRGGAIAQLGERLLCKQEVVGSIPSGSTSGDPDRLSIAALLIKLTSENEPPGSSEN